MINDVIKQDSIIKELYNYLESKNDISSLVKSALCTLDNMNEMQQYYINSIENEHIIGERILRLYALLQGLFVSIDSLYALANYLCGSKTFININQNEKLKELKYIRNDVVGHPVNRVYDNNQVAYCLLNPKDINETSISYKVFTNNKIQTKEVDLIDCLNNYYIESNELLLYLILFYKHNYKDNNLVKVTKDFYDNFNPKNYDESILRENYYKIYNTTNDKQSRYIARVNLLSKFKKNEYKGFKGDLYNYALCLQTKKLLEISYLLENQKVEVDINSKFPKYLMIFKDFLNSNKDYYNDLDILIDNNHPYFLSTLENIKQIGITSNNKLLIELTEWLLENEDNKEFIYLIASTFKTIKVY